MAVGVEIVGCTSSESLLIMLMMDFMVIFWINFLQDTDPFSASPGAWPELYSSDVSWVHGNYPSRT